MNLSDRFFSLAAGAMAVALSLATLAPDAADARTLTRKTVAYFAVGGTTSQELDRELARRGPSVKSTGSRHPGATEMKFGGSVKYRSSGGRCAVSDVTVTLATKLILPRWTNRRRAEKDLGLIWDTLSADIKRHEERHAEIARQHARMVEREIRALRPKANCKDLEADVAAVTERVLADHDRAQAQFDRVEAINFDRRMVRLLQYRLQQIKGNP